MIKRLLTSGIFIFISLSLHSQKHDFIWRTSIAEKTGDTIHPLRDLIIDFNYSPPQLTHLDYLTSYSQLTNSTISNSIGEFQFFSNGGQVVGKDDKIMPNGDTINIGPYTRRYVNTVGHVNAFIPQFLTSVPKPGSSSEYYLIYNKYDRSNYSFGNGLYYATIDMDKNGGNGEVLEKDLFVVRDSGQLGGLSAVKHANGRDWWVLYHKNLDKKFYRVLISPDGVQLNGEQQVNGEYLSEHNRNSRFSPDGKRFVLFPWSQENDEPPYSNFFYLYNFDRSTGLLSDEQKIYYGGSKERAGHHYANNAFGVEFSPNSKHLFISTIFPGIVQFDISSDNIQDSKTISARPKGYFHNQLYDLYGASRVAPNGNIYIVNGVNLDSYHVISQPNEYGIASKFISKGFQLPGLHSYSLPNHPNFRLGPIEDSPADSLGIEIEAFVWAQPYPEDGCPGGEAHFEITANGSRNKYRWQMSIDGHNWTDLQDNDVFSATDSTYLYLKNIPNDFNQRQFRCKVWNNKNMVFSNPATLTMRQAKPVATFDFTKVRDSIAFVSTTNNAEYLWWEFGDGELSYYKDIEYIFTEQGTYEVWHLAKNGCGIDTAKLTVNIDSLSTDIIADKTSGCSPLTVNFSSDSDYRTHTQYWFFPGGNPDFSPHQQNQITYTQPGTYDLEVRLTSVSNEKNVIILKDFITVHPPGDEPLPVSILQSGTADSIILSASELSGDFFRWTINGHFASDDATMEMPPLAPGIYEIVLESGNPCGTVSDTLVYVHELEANFSVDTQMVCPFEYVQFSNQSSLFADSIQWYFEGGFPIYSTEQNPVIRYTRDGHFDVRLTAFAKNESKTFEMKEFIEVFEQSVCDSLSSNGIIHSKNEITIFPNPAKSEITVFVKNKDFKSGKIEFYNSLGQLIFEQPISSRQHLIDLKNWNSGIYFYSVKSDSGTLKSGKLVVER